MFLLKSSCALLSLSSDSFVGPHLFNLITTTEVCVSGVVSEEIDMSARM